MRERRTYEREEDGPEPRIGLQPSDAPAVMVQPAIGVVLSHDPATNAVTAVGSLATPATSPALATILANIMNDAGQDAEVHFGRGQPLVSVGAFPKPRDMTGSRVQLIDIDDIENLEAGAPGHGLAKFAHEIHENYTAHSQIPVAGVDLFPVAHAAGTRAESDVASELVAPGADKVAFRSAPGASANETIKVRDFTVHFLVWTETRTARTSRCQTPTPPRAPRSARTRLTTSPPARAQCRPEGRPTPPLRRRTWWPIRRRPLA
jgi:hypothetical protein